MYEGWIYVLKLKHDCWYVGSTCQPEQRLRSHQGKNHGKGNSWVKRHGIVGNGFYSQTPISMGESLLKEELWTTLMLMEKYGYEKVRGSVWVAESLVKDAAEFTRRLIAETKNGCYACGGIGHKQDQCPEKRRGRCRKLQESLHSAVKGLYGTLRKIGQVAKINMRHLDSQLKTQINQLKSEQQDTLIELERLCEENCQLREQLSHSHQEIQKTMSLYRSERIQRHQAEQIASQLDFELEKQRAASILLSLGHH